MVKRLSRGEFLQNLSESGLFSPEEIHTTLAASPASQAADGEAVAQHLVASGKLTPYQAAAVGERRFAELVLGNYQILERIGAGGMGTVYKARHRRMKRVVALKVLSASVSQTAKFIQRFQREVEAVAQLSHPNIVMAYDAGEGELGHFLVMEFVNGRDLGREVDKRGPLPVGEAVACVIQAARGLGHAHGQGIIHRDVKPANLLRDVSGVVKVADLGLARFNDPLGQPAEGKGGLTQAGAVMGTVDFMPPEQALGLLTLDHRADVYSLGSTLYYLLTGRAPYEGPTIMATLLMHRDAPIPSLCAARPELPAALEAVFQRMVAKKPEERFASMTDVAQALEAVAPAPEFEAKQPVAPAAPQGKAQPPTVDIAEGTPDTLPAPSPAAAPQPTIDASPSPPAGTGAATVLLVEPSRTQAFIIRKYLQELGFQDVLTAPSGEKALAIARGGPLAAVISAMHLADMTGVQLAEKMREPGPLAAVGFVLITSEADAEAANRVSQAGHAVQLPKPFDRDGLARALAAAVGGSPGDPRVLVVDDSALARSHARKVLAGLGLSQVVEAADGAEAMRLLEKEDFDLVVTDYHMPRVDGPGLIEFIRRRSARPSVPVIVVTTETDPAALAAVRRLGVAAVCDKSFPPEVVRGVLKQLQAGEPGVSTPG
jgi:serine/threonine protein kinase/DNA-binding NarL/FixJ family response regulator